MKRDFTEEAKTTLFGLIDEINDEKSSSITDWLSNYSVFALADIEDDLGFMNAYYNKILYKNNTTKEQINTIFKNVNAVDQSYASTFSTYNQDVEDQIDYIKALADCINPSGSNLNIESIKNIMDRKKAKIQSAKVKRYIEKLKKGVILKKGAINYNYKLINQTMAKDPKDVEPEMYLALISVFGEMNCEEKSKFIENCYIDGSPYLNAQNTNVANYEFVLSDVFSTMISVCGSITSQLDPENEANTKFLSNYNLLYAISAHAKNIYVSEFFFTRDIKKQPDLNVNIRKATSKGHMEYDYRVEFNGSSTPYNKGEMLNNDACNLDVYQSRGVGGQDGIFDKHVEKVAECFRMDVDLENTKTLMDFADSAAMLFVETNPATDVGISVVKTTTELTTNTINAKEANDRVDKINTLLNDGNIYQALTIDTYFSFDSNGNYSVSSYKFDSDELKSRLNTWNNEINTSDPIDVESVIEKIQSGHLDDWSEIESYLEWYCEKDGAK